MILRPIYWLLFKLFGWKVKGPVPSQLNKYVMIVVPHTSMWDFMVGLCARSIIREDVKYIGKKELFWFPLGILLKALGGFPVDRGKGSGMVGGVVELFNTKDHFKICIAPEGTRSKVDHLKSGFWHIATKANVPVVCVGFDYPSKSVVIREPIEVGESQEADMASIVEYFKQFRGKHPEKDMAS